MSISITFLTTRKYDLFANFYTSIINSLLLFVLSKMRSFDRFFFCVGSLNISTRWWCSRMSQKETREDCFHIFHLSCPLPYQMCEVNVWRVWERMWRARGRYIIIFQNEKTKAKIAKRKLKISNNLFIEILVYKCFSRTKVLWWLSRGAKYMKISRLNKRRTSTFNFSCTTEVKFIFIFNSQIVKLRIQNNFS